MTEKHDNGKQVVKENVNNDEENPRKVDVNNNHDSVAGSSDSTDTLATEQDMRRAPLSRGSTLDSIREEDDSTSLEERLMFESFKSITDIFENEGKDESQVVDEKNVSSLPRTSHTDSLISEDADSLDEEVRTIMLKSEEKRRQNQVKLLHMVKIPSEEENKAKVDPDDSGNAKENEDKELNEVEREDFLEEIEDQDVVYVSDTESSSESESDSNESDEDDNRSVTQWSLNENDEGSSSDQEEFDLDSYLTKLCNESSDSGSEFDDDSTTMSDLETKRAVRKAMKPYMEKCFREDSDDSSSEDDESEKEKEEQDDEGDEGDDDYSSVVSSSGTISDFFDDDSASVSTASSTDSYFDVDDRDELDAETSQSLTDEPPYVPEPTIASHELVYKYYLSNRSESTPNKIEVHNGEIGNNLGLENTLTSRSVVNLRWPYSNYYVKEFKLDNDKVPIKDEGLLPSYKSMKSSASFPGRRRNVMLGRVWWVEWWAEDALENEKVEENKDGYGVEDNLEEVEKLDHFEPEKQNSHL